MVAPAEAPLSKDRLQADQAQMLGALVQAGRWSEINPTMFPVLPKPSVEFAREVAFDNRIEYIGKQMGMLQQLIDVFSNRSDTDIPMLANGRQLEFENELAAILKARNPDTKPVPLTKQEETGLLLNRDTNVAFQFFFDRGEIDKLNPETIPALKHLSTETLLELKIDALLAKLARYVGWKESETNDKFGFRSTNGDTSNLHQLSEQRIRKTAAQIDSLSAELLELDKLK